jgi:ferrous iron transport protein B
MTIWHRSWLYLKKAGTVILMTSVLLWAAGQWPGLKAEEKAGFEERIAEASASGLEAKVLEETLSEIENERSMASLEASLVGRVGKLLEPVMRPCGFDWRVTTALLPGLAAKELVVTQLGIVFALGETDEGSDTLRKKLRENYTPVQAFCIMLFCLMSAPCLATVAVVKQECGGWRWAFGQLAGLTLLAWCSATIVYQIGSRIVF